MSVALAYGEFCEKMGAIKIEEHIFHHAKRATIDWFASTIPGGLETPAKLTFQALKEEIGNGASTILPAGQKTTPRNAALINGTASHTLEFDDIFRAGLYHPGSPVISAVLALADANDVSGEHFLRAVIVGYEVSNRIASVMVPAHYDFWHTTATVGFFGATAASSYILGSNAEQTAHALATSASMAAGLQQAFQSDAMTKPIHAGRAAEGGVLAASLAREGITGVLDIFEADRGFGRAMSDTVDWVRALDGLGSYFTIEQITQKNHAACGHVHAIIDAIIQLKMEEEFEIETIEQITIGSYQKVLDICDNPEPVSTNEAKFSAQFCAASAFVKGRSLRTKDFLQNNLKDPLVKNLLTKVVLDVDQKCQKAFPNARSAKVKVKLRNGEELESFAPTRKGDPDHPMSDTELSEKYMDLVQIVFGEENTRLLLEEMWTFEQITSMREFNDKHFDESRLRI